MCAALPLLSLCGGKRAAGMDIRDNVMFCYNAFSTQNFRMCHLKIGSFGYCLCCARRHFVSIKVFKEKQNTGVLYTKNYIMFPYLKNITQETIVIG